MTTYRTSPLTQDEIRNILMNGESIEEIICIGLWDLVGNDIESVNNLAEDQILGQNGYELDMAEGDNPIVNLSDITFRVVGHINDDNGSGSVLLQVNAQLIAY